MVTSMECSDAFDPLVLNGKVAMEITVYCTSHWRAGTVNHRVIITGQIISGLPVPGARKREGILYRAMRVSIERRRGSGQRVQPDAA
jgi:hypothetical protein